MKDPNFTLLCILALAVSFLLMPTAARSAAAPYERGCVEEIVNEQPVERCGLGYWRTLCGWNAGVEECETFFELIEEDVPQTKISNVLFLPGIKGSRLYRTEPACEGSATTCALKLWEPYGNALAEQLFLSEDGHSVHENVYARAGDVLSAALGQRFYASFITDLNELMISGRFGPGWYWEAGAYDWRLSLDDLVTRGEREDDRVYFNRPSDTPYLETQLRNLAANSPTGKVTIIAHSNGGLVAKALAAKLGSDASSLIDSMVFVGVPHFGAPQALGALLFGHGEALPFDTCARVRVVSELCALLMDRPTARAFAEHAPMAYHLLPSQSYFEATRANVNDMTTPSIVTFNGHASFAAEQGAYGNGVDSESELHAFAVAKEGGRERPARSDTSRANILSASLLAYARTVHDSLDSWRAPTGISVHHIIGWGKETISGIEFYEEPSVLGIFGSTIPRYRPLLFFEGDGVVPSVSAQSHDFGSINPIPVSLPHGPLSRAELSAEQRYWIDLSAINADSIGGGYGHGTLFEIDSVRQLLTNLIDDVSSAESALPPHITITKPAVAAERSWIRIFLHSPLTLELYSEGKHLGVTHDGRFENEIPGATYDEFGEVKYVSMPAGIPYSVVMRGYGTGHFSLDIQEVAGSEKTTTTVSQVLVTPELIARMELPAESPAQTTLSLDHDGDGVADEAIELIVGETKLYVDENPTDETASSSPSDPKKRPSVLRNSDAIEGDGSTLGAAHYYELKAFATDEFSPRPETVDAEVTSSFESSMEEEVGAETGVVISPAQDQPNEPILDESVAPSRKHIVLLLIVLVIGLLLWLRVRSRQ